MMCCSPCMLPADGVVATVMLKMLPHAAGLLAACRLQDLWQACVAYAASPEVQLQVFNSAAYAAMWSDSPATAQAFTSQVGLVAASCTGHHDDAVHNPAPSSISQSGKQVVCDVVLVPWQHVLQTCCRSQVFLASA